MSLHLIKLCVGAESIADLEAWIAQRLAAKRARGEAPEQFHTTRMVPKRVKELLAGGSLYWVVRGFIACRQRLVDIRPFTDADGVGRCNLVLEPIVIPVETRPRGAFQGWRYFTAKDAPADLDSGAASTGIGAMPETLRRELADLGLL